MQAFAVTNGHGHQAEAKAFREDEVTVDHMQSARSPKMSADGLLGRTGATCAENLVPGVSRLTNVYSSVLTLTL